LSSVVETTAANITIGDVDDDDDYDSNYSNNADIVWRTIISKQTKSGVQRLTLSIIIDNSR